MLVTRAGAAHGFTAARIAAGLVFVLLATASAARADVQSFDGVDQPIVRVNVKAGNVTIRTWDRPSVQVDADPSLEVFRRPASLLGNASSIAIPEAHQASASGVVDLPPENFVANIAPGDHEVIVVRDRANAPFGESTPVTVTIPNTTAFVFARTGDGTLDVHDYRAGTFVGFVGRGRMQLTGIGGTAFTQTLRGPTVVIDSTFDRYRARSLFGDITCERCNVRQIQATSINGSIVYDGGSFEPGLARFESERGDVAVGTTGSAQLSGHASASGHVYTNFARAAHVDARGNDTDVDVGGGGPVVNASSGSGNVYLYDGSVRTRTSAAWQAPNNALNRPGLTVHGNGPPPASEPALFRRRFPNERESQPHHTFRRPHSAMQIRRYGRHQVGAP